MNRRPVVAITMGDPAGVGPEVAAKALAREEVWDCCRPLVVGDAGVLAQAVVLATTLSSQPANQLTNELTNQLTNQLANQPAPLRSIADAAEACFDPIAPDVLDLRNVDPTALQSGQVSATAGRAAVAYVERAVGLALEGKVDGIATGPINKAALKAAGISHIGHTELLAALTGAERVTTMLATPGLRVVHVIRHVPLREVAAHITRERVLETIRLTDAGLREMGILGCSGERSRRSPRLAVAALNPHGGDEGLLGREEIEVIGPAVEMAQAEGIDARGPIPADSVFFRAIRGEFDAVVAMYHDQGHIPIKTHGFERSVTVTLGLPIVRTSVDHGTAFDIAWQGIASEESMVEAIRLAARLAARRGSV